MDFINIPRMGYMKLTKKSNVRKLNQEISAMWWLGCTGIWLKSEKNTNILVIYGVELVNVATETENENWTPNAPYEWLPKLTTKLTYTTICYRSI